MKYLILAATALILASPVFADGDSATGEKDFKKCKACHSISNGDEVLVKGGKTGPNLYGVVGRAAGSYPDFRYSKVMEEAGEKGLIWSAETLVEYLPDPSKFLEDFSGDSSGRSKMTFKLTKGAEDIAAYLATMSPESAETGEETEGADAKTDG